MVVRCAVSDLDCEWVKISLNHYAIAKQLVTLFRDAVDSCIKFYMKFLWRARKVGQAGR